MNSWPVWQTRILRCLWAILKNSRSKLVAVERVVFTELIEMWNCQCTEAWRLLMLSHESPRECMTYPTAWWIYQWWIITECLLHPTLAQGDGTFGWFGCANLLSRCRGQRGGMRTVAVSRETCNLDLSSWNMQTNLFLCQMATTPCVMLAKVEVPGLTLRSVLVHGEAAGQLCTAVHRGELFLIVLVGPLKMHFSELASMLWFFGDALDFWKEPEALIRASLDFQGRSCTLPAEELICSTWQAPFCWVNLWVAFKPRSCIIRRFHLRLCVRRYYIYYYIS